MSDMRRGEVSNKASKVDGIHTKSYCVYTQYDLVWMPSKFLSAPEDGRKKRPKHVQQYCSYK